MFQYIALGIVYGDGRPHRLPFLTNRPLCVALAIFTAFSAWLVMGPLPDILVNVFEVIPAPALKDRLAYLALGLTSAMAAFTFEATIIRRWLEPKYVNKLVR